MGTVVMEEAEVVVVVGCFLRDSLVPSTPGVGNQRINTSQAQDIELGKPSPSVHFLILVVLAQHQITVGI